MENPYNLTIINELGEKADTTTVNAKIKYIIKTATLSYKSSTGEWTITGLDDLKENGAYLCEQSSGTSFMVDVVYLNDSYIEQHITIPFAGGNAYGISFGYELWRVYSSNAWGSWTLNYLRQATPTLFGGVKIALSTLTGTKVTTPTTGTENRIYQVQKHDSDENLVVNVPWSTDDCLKLTGGTLSGDVSATAFYETSDLRKKDIVEKDIDLEKAYSMIEACSTILYKLKDSSLDKVQLGMIAQEVEEFFPELIQEDAAGFKSLDYSRITVIILRVLKDLIQRINKLEGK